MQDTPTTTSPSPIDRFRQWIKTLAGNIFAAPYLPIPLTVFFIATVITNLAVTLMSQPLSYWNSAENAVGMGIFGEELSLGAGALIAVAVIYTVIAVLLLTFVHYRWSLVGWLMAEFIHFYIIQEMLAACYVSRWSVLLGDICTAADYEIFWLVAAIFTGGLLVFTFQPAEFPLENRIIKKGVSVTTGLLPIGWIILLVIGVFLSAQRPSFGWVPVEVKNSPGELRESESAYDIKRGRLVVFGGSTGYIGNDQWNYITATWEWDGNQWLKMSPAETPLARADHAMAYDEKRGVVVLFGGFHNGERLSDTWEWDGTNWQKMESSSDPIARSGHEMIYDREREKVVIYGGYDGENFHRDAWEWNGSGWTQLELDSNAPTASVFAMDYHPNENYAFSMMSGSGGTWHWQGNSWTRLTPEVEPSNRGWTSLVYDQSRGLFFTFGGISRDEYVNDTWTSNGEEWNKVDIRGVKPAARADMLLWYDPVRKHVMLYGGYGEDITFDDMWEFIPSGK